MNWRQTNRIDVLLWLVCVAAMVFLLATRAEGQGTIPALDVGGWRASGACPPGMMNCPSGGCQTITVPRGLFRKPIVIRQQAIPQSQVQAPRPGYVRIRVPCRDGSTDYGSGTVINSSSGNRVWILTCWHIFRDQGGPITVSVPGRATPYPATMASQQPAHDVAIIVCNAGPITPVCVASNQPAVGSLVRTGGYFQGAAWQWSQGVVSGYLGPSRNASPVSGIQTTAAVGEGESGGPILDGRGYIVGVISSRIPSPNPRSDAAGCAVPMLRTLFAKFIPPVGYCSDQLTPDNGKQETPLIDKEQTGPPMIVESEEPPIDPDVLKPPVVSIPDEKLEDVQPWAPLEDVIRNTEAIAGLDAELDELQERVASIRDAPSLELVEGPRGPKGDRGLQGLPGKRGEPGPQGEPGMLVRLTADQYTEEELEALAESLVPHLPPLPVRQLFMERNENGEWIVGYEEREQVYFSQGEGLTIRIFPPEPAEGKQ